MNKWQGWLSRDPGGTATVVHPRGIPCDVACRGTWCVYKQIMVVFLYSVVHLASLVQDPQVHIHVASKNQRWA